jgi:prepilin-type processing-associated H-X9-DG protein
VNTKSVRPGHRAFTLVELLVVIGLRHKDGVNVLYGDGSAHWVGWEGFKAEIKACPAIDPAANPHQDAIWAVLDGG